MSKSEVGPPKNWPGAADSYSPEVKALKLSYVLEKDKATQVTGKYTISHQNR